MFTRAITRAAHGVLVGLFLATAGLGSAQAAPKVGGTLTFGLPTDLTKLDPHKSSAFVDTTILMHVVEPLVTYNKKLEIRPLLADSWKFSADYTSLTMNLAKGKTFHNGREMVADDVVWSFKRLLDPETKNPKRSLFENIAKVTALDAHTVRFDLAKPQPGFLHVLANANPIPAILPKETVDADGNITKLIGTGPFQFVEWKPTQYIELKRYAAYKSPAGPKDGLSGDRTPYIDTLKMVPVSEENVAVMALLNKEIDVLQYFPAKYVEKYNKQYSKQGMVLSEVPGMSWYQVFFGLNKPVTDNPDFRRAVAYALDLDEITRAAYMGHALVNPSVIPAQSGYYTKAQKTWVSKDLKKAKALLKKAGYKGEEVVIDTTKNYAPMYKQAIAMQSQMAAAGINAKVNVLEWPVLLKRLYGKDFQMLSFGIGPKPDPVSAYNYLRLSSAFDVYPEIKALVDKADSTDDDALRRDLFDKIHLKTLDTVPWIEFYNYNYLNAYRDYVKGYETLSIGLPVLWGVWLDK
ncbi:ABC transporter substrate-binding protein [Oleispirillum naphthae]|uniref:ABC transporter substrate-binding protein n=1 Tax=Oleispirillum naphthae TaxID=2838853 RepID=UPI0030824E1E